MEPIAGKNCLLSIDVIDLRPWIFLFVLYFVFVSITVGSNLNPIHQTGPYQNHPEAIYPSDRDVLGEITLHQEVRHILGVDSNVQFRNITPSYTSPDIVHLQQVFAGVDVSAAILAVRLSDDGKVSQVYGEVLDGVGQALKRQANRRERSAAKAISPANKLAWVADAQWLANHVLLPQTDQGQWTISQLVQSPAFVSIAGQVRRVERVEFYAENISQQRFVRPALDVDPDSHIILQQLNRLNYSVQAGSGPGGNLMTGPQQYPWVGQAIDALSAGTFLVTRSGTDCTLGVAPEDGSWQNNVQVLNGTDASAAYRYPCNEKGLHEEDLSIPTGAYSPLNDASYSAQVAFNLYANFAITRAKGPLNEIGRPLIVKARYGYVDNAFWNGEFIALGDGARYFYPKVAPDTLGHELAHAVLEHYSLLSQGGGTSMGIAESFADIAGEATEYAIAQQSFQQNDWRYAAATFKPTLADAARYFEQPSLDGKSIDTPKDRHYQVTGHHLAGPFNRAFFHLVTDNAARGWTPLIGFDLWLTAAANCWVPIMQYESAAQCIVDSAATFRAHNSALPSDWNAEAIRYAVIRAFARVDIMTTSDTELVALFDYKRVFDGLLLRNTSSVGTSTSPVYDWDLGDDGSIDQVTQRLVDTVDILPAAGADRLVVRLRAQAPNQQDDYLREIDLAPDYCIPSGSGDGADYIRQVSLNGTAMAVSETEPGGYADYTAEPPLTLNLAGENSIILTPNDDLYFRRWMVFADLNGDHDFSDPGETLLETRSQGAITGAIDLTGGSPANKGQTTRLRVLMDWASASRPCGRASMGEYEDYRVTLVTQPDPMPEPMVAFSYGVVADSTVVQFENRSESVPAGATWSWQYRRLDQARYTEFAATHGARFDFGQAGDYSVQLILTTPLGSEYPVQERISLTADGPADHDYCAAGSVVDGLYIRKVGIHHKGLWNILINSSAVGAEQGYTLYGSELLKQALPRGETIWISVTAVGSATSSKKIGAWLDLNQNHRFDRDENIYLTGGNNPATTWIEVALPVDAPTGPTRLRLIVKSDAVPDACELISLDQGSGEVEDYIVIIE